MESVIHNMKHLSLADFNQGRLLDEVDSVSSKKSICHGSFMNSDISAFLHRVSVNKNILRVLIR